MTFIYILLFIVVVTQHLFYCFFIMGHWVDEWKVRSDEIDPETGKPILKQPLEFKKIIVKKKSVRKVTIAQRFTLINILWIPSAYKINDFYEAYDIIANFKKNGKETKAQKKRRNKSYKKANIIKMWFDPEK